MSENNLKPCPFCGGEAKLHKEKLDIFGVMRDCYSVYCTKCCCQTQYSGSENEAVRDWNKRTCSCKKHEE